MVVSFVVIIRGPLAVGKTTIAKLLAKKLNALYISMDAVLEKHGWDVVPPGALCIPLQNFLKADDLILPLMKKKLVQKTPVVIDGCFYHKKQVHHLKKHIPSPCYVFTLKAPVTVCIARDKKRKKSCGKGAAIAVHTLVSKFDYGVVIDVSKGTADKVVKKILTLMSV